MRLLNRSNRWGSLASLTAVLLALGCGGGAARVDGAAGSGGSPVDGRLGRAGAGGAGNGAAGAGGKDAGQDVPIGQEDAGEDGDAPFLPEVPEAICPTIDGGASAVDGGQGPSGPDNVIFLGNATVATLTGTGMAGAMNGAAAVATFDNPVSIALSPTGDLVVCDFENDMLRLLAMPKGTLAVSTLTVQAGFTRPYGLVFDKAARLYVDTDYNKEGGKNIATGTIWSVDTTTGVATPVAENIGRPRGLAALADGRLVLGDYQNARDAARFLQNEYADYKAILTELGLAK